MSETHEHDWKEITLLRDPVRRYVCQTCGADKAEDR